MKFIRSFCTNTRLMGAMMLLIEWSKDDKIISHVFMLDAEGLGISDFYRLENESEHDRESFYRQKYGGLGGRNIDLNEDEAVFLVNQYMNKNKWYEKPIPENFDIDKQNFYSDRLSYFEEKYPNENREKEVFEKICKKIESENEFVNYMVMRLVARDRESLMYFSGNENVADIHLTNINGALLYNEIEKKTDDRFVCNCVFEDNDGYYESKVVVIIDKMEDKEAGSRLHEGKRYKYRLRGFMIISTNGIYDFEVFDIISKRETVDIYDIKDSQRLKEIEFKIYNAYPSIQGIEFHGGNLYIQYFMDNTHVDNHTYIINNDIMFLIYVNGKNIFLATYNDQARIMIEESLSDQIDGMAEKKDTLFFEQNVLFDFIESGNEDFYDFLD